jgi:anti-sigma factor RsiW
MRLVTDLNGTTTWRALEAFGTYAGETEADVLPGAIGVGDGGAAHLASWTQKHLGRRIAPQTLAGDTAQLLGAYVTPGEFGPAAFLVYRDEAGQKFGLFLSRSPLWETVTSYADEAGTGLAVGVTAYVGISAAVVGAYPRDRLMAMIETVQARLQQGN